MKELKAQNKKPSEFHEFFRNRLLLKEGAGGGGGKSHLPETCLPIAGLLLGAITGYYEQEMNSISFVSVINTQIAIPKDETNGLQGT